jgi:alkylation response protein AidB-like acyl-CoA dehydrogenase
VIQWSESHEMMQDAVRRFIEAEIVPHVDEFEHGDTPPYDVLRKMFRSFGIDQVARERFSKQIAREKKIAAGEIAPEAADASRKRTAGPEAGDALAMQVIPIIELCRYCPGMVTAMGVSVGLTAAAINSKGTIAQKERWVPDLLTLDKVGSWAITEPGSGSDAFGGMKSTARRDGDGYILNGSKTFITNGPYADTLVFICRLDEGNPPAERKVLTFVLERGMAGLEQSRPVRKMGMHSSPTGDLFLSDVRVGREYLLGETEKVTARDGAKDTFSSERTGVAAMALGIVEQCLKTCIEYAKTRVAFGRPIGDFQLIQLKLAKMEVARMNIRNLVFRQIELAAAGVKPTFAEASAIKLYSAQAAMDVCLEAVQLHGGNGYMAEYRVEQLCRDAKVLQIYAGTDEIQVSQIARSLLA